jgi:predicted acetyltransferase
LSTFEYGPVPQEEAQALASLLSDALHFNMNAEEITRYVERVGYETFRLVRQDGRMAAGLGIIETAQWFGGRKVPAIAISPVGAAPEFRGRGASSHLLQKMHEEVRERGYPLACLYPATLTFYRRSGYEKAGSWNTYELSTDAIHGKHRDMDLVHVIDEAGNDEIRRVYEARARLNNGHLERWPNLWQRMLQGKDKTVHKYLAHRDGLAEGYACYVQGGQVEQTRIVDWCALTRDAALRLLTLFADDRTMTSGIKWHGGPSDPFLFLLPEPQEKVAEVFDWVIRVTDVEKALSLRGYPAELSTEIHFAVHDEQLPWNDGRFVLRIEDGIPEVRRGGDGRLALHARTLVPLYTGYLTPMELRLVGGLEGDDRDLVRAQMAFSGPRPWMPDIF